MLHSKNIVSFVIVAVACCSTVTSITIPHRYEETITYWGNPHCKPSTLDTGLQCCDIGNTVTIKGGLYTNYELHYVPLASAYYVARYADALGFQNRCPTNTTFLKELDMMVPWSGNYGAISIDGVCGYKDLIRRTCTFPTTKYPFLCKGTKGTPGTYGERLEVVSYNSILEGKNNRWTLFVQCWRAKTPQNPDSEEIATSFNVFNLDPVFTKADKELVIKELKKRGFNTHPSNIIEFDYSTQNCS